MKYFKYQYSTMGTVWGLFAGMSTENTEDVHNNRSIFSHTLEIVNSAMNGNINVEGFNLKAYETTCSKTDEIEKNKSRDKYLTIIDTVNGDDDNQSVGYGEISSNKLKSIEDAFEEFERKDEFEKNLESLYDMRKEYIIKEGVDIIEMLRNSLQGIPEALGEMKELVQKDDILKSLIEALCASDMLLEKLQNSINRVNYLG